MKQRIKSITLDGLAGMVSRGFVETAKKKDMDDQFSEVNVRLDRIENSILKHQAHKVLMLEKRVQRLENLFAVK